MLITNRLLLAHAAGIGRCPAYEVCVPLSGAQLVESAKQLPSGTMLGDVGICTQPLPNGLLLPNTSLVPPPLCACLLFVLFCDKDGAACRPSPWHQEGCCMHVPLVVTMHKYTSPLHGVAAVLTVACLLTVYRSQAFVTQNQRLGSAMMELSFCPEGQYLIWNLTCLQNAPMCAQGLLPADRHPGNIPSARLRGHSHQQRGRPRPPLRLRGGLQAQ